MRGDQIAAVEKELRAEIAARSQKLAAQSRRLAKMAASWPEKDRVAVGA